MSHLDEGVLHAVLDGEVPSTELTEITQHLADCRECQRRMDEARAFRTEAFGLIETLDRPAAPAIASGSAITPMVRPIRPRTRWWIPATWAASIILAVGLGYQVRRNRDLAVPPAEELALTPVRGDSNASDRDQPLDQPTVAEAPRNEARRPAAPATPAPQQGFRKDLAAGAASPATSQAAETTVVALNQQAAEPAGREAPKAAAPPMPVAADKKESDARTEDEGTSRRMVASRARALNDAETGRGGAAATSPLGKSLLRLDRPALANPADQRTRIVSAVTAIRILGGSIRLVDGLTPSRFEQVGDLVRVVYRTGFGVVTLEQWRAGELLAHELIAPTGTPPDSILAWEKRIR